MVNEDSITSKENVISNFNGTRRALYLNKFGIMHLGLVGVVKDMESASDVDEIILGICSSQYNDQNKSPSKADIYNCLSWQEREAAMKVALRDLKKPIHYVAIPDLQPIDKSMPENKWINQVIAQIPKFNCIYTERDVEAICMEAKGKEIRPVAKTVIFSDHCIRDKIAREEIWEPYFSQGVPALLKEFSIESRYKKLYEKLELPRWVAEEGLDKNIDFEWRTFCEKEAYGQIEHVRQADIDRIMALEQFKEQKLVDKYIVSLTRTSINMKLTDTGIKIKELMRSKDGIEEWITYDMKYPISREEFRGFCKQRRFPVRSGLPDTFGEKELLECMPDHPNPYIMPIAMTKERHMRLYREKDQKTGNDLRVGIEVAYFNLFGNNYVTIGLEAKNRDDVMHVVDKLGLKEYKPMNYIQFLEKKIVQEYDADVFKSMMVK